MGTCSIATSARRAHDIRRRLFCGVDADGTARHQLGTQLRDLELDSVKGGNGGQVRGNEEDASSVCSVKVEYSMASPSSCLCPHHCAALGRSSSTSTVSSDCSFSPATGGVVVTEHATTRAEEERGVTGNNRVKWFAAIAFVVVMGVIVAMVVMELGVDEFLVPT